MTSYTCGIEPFCTIKQAAGRLNLPYWKLQRAIKRREIPSYAPFNSRRLVRLSEVVACIEQTMAGGVR